LLLVLTGLIVLFALTQRPVVLASAIARGLRGGDKSSLGRMLADLPRTYNPAGRYVGPLETNIHPPEVILASDGMPRVRYEPGYRRNPVTSAQYGLWAYGSGHLRVAVHVADDLVATQKRGGTWTYDFDFAPGAGTVVLKAPWASAMAEGQAMSLLERVYRFTGRQRYLDAALRAIKPLQTPVKRGGLRRCFFGDCTRPFFEEYPTKPPSYVLNGFMFTLIGLYDLSSVAPHSDAREMLRDGLRTLSVALPKYDVRGTTSYDLMHLTVRRQRPLPADDDYEAVHVYLLRALAVLSHNEQFVAYADRWARRL
jgi:heparosan-N-sulfate-glucuronate 5-epimerase